MVCILRLSSIVILDMTRFWTFLFFISIASLVCAQTTSLENAVNKLKEKNLVVVEKDTLSELIINGHKVSALISGEDTLYYTDLQNINISSPRKFDSNEDYLKYLKYRRYATKVYPFAKQAIRIFREAEYVSETMKKRKRKKYLRKLSKDLQREFEDPLKRLSKTQGKILVKMIEREIETPMFELIKMTQGKLKAFYWNQSSKLYGYRLKTGYAKGDNEILDVVLQDYDISYQIVED